MIEEIGRGTAAIWRDIVQLLTFVGELTAALVFAVLKPHTVRWKDVWRVCERVGADALPIVALISFLLGMILAFQSAVPMKRFGAEIFVADLIGLSMLRELGPLMTAILLAGRSGAAFAAEIGTMRVNQEVDALVTMGLDPVRFLVTPRIIAALLMTPLLVLFSMLIGLVGGAITMTSFSIPFVTFMKEVDSAVSINDFLAGFVKSFVFAILIAGIGCLRGLQTAAGASAVGESATKAVVSGIILLVVVDGLFAVAFYILEHLMATAPDTAREPADPPREFRGDPNRRPPGDVLIEVEHLDAGYDGKAILDDVNFSIRAGEVFGILGGSGGGKSTILKHMIGLVPPVSGPGEVRRRGHRRRRRGGTRRASAAASASCTSRARCSAR